MTPKIIESPIFCLTDIQFSWQAENLLEMQVLTPIYKNGGKIKSTPQPKYQGKTLMAYFEFVAAWITSSSNAKVEVLSPKPSEGTHELVQFRITIKP